MTGRSVKTLRIAAAQTSEYRDDIDAALDTISDVSHQAAAAGARLLCFPEGFLQGYLLDPIDAQRVALEVSSPRFTAVLERLSSSGPTIVFGMIEREAGHLFNTAVIVEQGVVIGRYRKRHLLKGEQAFAPGAEIPVFETEGMRFGINICSDTNLPDGARAIADQKGKLILCPANNMMPAAKAEEFRHVHNAVRGDRCKEAGLWLISADVTGERDGRIALGPTAVLDPKGQVVAQLPLGSPGLLVFDLPL